MHAMVKLCTFVVCRLTKSDSMRPSVCVDLLVTTILGPCKYVTVRRLYEM